MARLFLFISGTYSAYLKPEFCSSAGVADNTRPVAVQWQITLGRGR
jgi:hypothetical protein